MSTRYWSENFKAKDPLGLGTDKKVVLKLRYCKFAGWIQMVEMGFTGFCKCYNVPVNPI